MKHKLLVLTRDAERDVEDILRFIARRDGRRSAARFHEKLRKACRHVSFAPATGSTRLPEAWKMSERRTWPLHPYLLLYHDLPDAVVVLRIFHHKQNGPAPREK